MTQNIASKPGLEEELRAVLNRHNVDAELGMPDHLIAAMVVDWLQALQLAQIKTISLGYRPGLSSIKKEPAPLPDQLRRREAIIHIREESGQASGQFDVTQSEVMDRQRELSEALKALGVTDEELRKA
ncbi:hypothetical protein SEA_LITTLEFELLA_73 [Gordonia phage LittleFella]|nr:hypothetical protein SEA_LITTLEFELLA_73 [Gordonia phage LittleFella]